MGRCVCGDHQPGSGKGRGQPVAVAYQAAASRRGTSPAQPTVRPQMTCLVCASLTLCCAARASCFAALPPGSGHCHAATGSTPSLLNSVFALKRNSVLSVLDLWPETYFRIIHSELVASLSLLFVTVCWILTHAKHCPFGSYFP